MPYETSGTTHPVVRPDLTNPANIESAFNLFYEGAGGSDYGVEHYISDLDARVALLEAGSPASGSFLATEFELRNGSNYKLTFGIAGLSADRQLTVPNAAGTIVLEAHTQTLTNKTLSGASNVVYVRDNNFRIQSSDTDYLEFNTDAITGVQYAGIRDFGAGVGLTDYIVFEGLAQTVSSKTFTGYKEAVTSVATTLSGTVQVSADAYNVVFASCTSPTANGTFSVDVTNLNDGASVFIVFKGDTTRTLTPVLKVAGSTSGIKWASNTVAAAITANATARYGLVSVSKIGNVVFATYLGEYY